MLITIRKTELRTINPNYLFYWNRETIDETENPAGFFYMRSHDTFCGEAAPEILLVLWKVYWWITEAEIDDDDNDDDDDDDDDAG